MKGFGFVVLCVQQHFVGDFRVSHRRPGILSLLRGSYVEVLDTSPLRCFWG